MISRLRSIFLILILLLTNNKINAQTSFAVIGDYGKGGSAEADVSDMIDTLDVDFVITLGDNNYNNGSASTIDNNIGKDYNQWIYPYVGNYPPGGSQDGVNRFFPSLGNHDYNNTTNPDDAQPYLDYFSLPNNERWYTFSWGKVDFFILDSPLGWNAEILAEQWAWLQGAVANSTGVWRIVYFHHPPYSSRYSHTRMRLDFNSLDIHLVLSGHDHKYERLEINGLTYIINGLGGKSLYGTHSPIDGSIIQYGDDFGAQLIEATETTLSSKFYNRSGDLIDSWLINGSLPVELISFTGKVISNYVLLEWQTVTETNNHGFFIERNGDIIGFLEGHGNSNSPKHYTFNDTDIGQSGEYYYRLKQIDNDGTFEYSDVVIVTVGVPVLFALSQNYPNPFNPETRIDYTLLEQQNVSLRVYNMLGEMVQELLNEVKPPGSYYVTFDASNLPSGIYIYRIQTESFAVNKKMTLLK